MVGQEQDRNGGDFNSAESFVGTLYALQIWDMVLLPEDVNTLHNTCDEVMGNLVSWGDVLANTKGELQHIPSAFCQGIGYL